MAVLSLGSRSLQLLASEYFESLITTHWSLAAFMLPGVARCHRLILNISHLNLDATNVSKAPWFLSVGKVLGDYSMDTKSSLLLCQLLILNPSVDIVRK